jgi:hypothetical protein
MKLDPSILARIQFAFTVSFHIIFPTMSIGLASFLALIEALWLKTKNPTYLQIYRFRLNIFAMGFGIGVVTGIVLSFEFGLGFARFAQMAGPAIGPLIALEVLTAFFLRGRIFRNHALRFSSRRLEAALFRNLHGGGRYAYIGFLDTFREQLDADTGWSRNS